MNNIPPLVRNIGAGVLLCALLFFAYMFTINKKTDAGPLTESGPVADQGVSEASPNVSDIEIIEKAHEHLTALSSIDTSILSDPVLLSLKDFRNPLSPSDPSLVPKGRDDPFAPLPGTSQKRGVSGGR